MPGPGHGEAGRAAVLGQRAIGGSDGGIAAAGAAEAGPVMKFSR